ncbi:hypothetical protein V6N13_099593 [Hibiscus sabdariffa]
MVDSVPIVDKPDPLDSQGLDLEQFSSLGGSITAATGGDGKVYVSPPQTVLSNGAQQWSNALIGNFLGKSPTLNVFQRTTNRLWGREGSVEIRFLASSVYIINLSSMRVRDWVLESGPCHINQKALVLCKWMSGVSFDVVRLDSSSVWVKLWHVPLELFSQQGLSYVASALGKPLYMDRTTTLKLQLEFAKLCIEVAATDDIPSSVVVDLGEGRMVDIGVELVWSPPKCEHCAIFGHSSLQCPQVKAKEAVVLSNEQASGAPLNGLGEVSGEPLYGAGEISMGEWLYVVENVAPLDDIVETANTMEVLRCSEIVSGGVVVVGIPNVVEHSVVSSNRFDALYDVSEGQNGDDMFYLYAIYACHGRNERVALWNDLLRLRGRVGGCPWRVAGVLGDLLRAEDKFLHQKPRAQFLAEGDQNTDFFFRQVAIRQKANTIKAV